MLMSAHIEDMQRRGVLTARRPHDAHQTLIMSLSEAVHDAGSRSPEDTQGAPDDVKHHGQMPHPRAIFGDLIHGLADRMREMAENIATQNEAAIILMRELSAVKEGMAMVLESIGAGFAHAEQASANRHGEVLRELSEIRDRVGSEHPARGRDAAILAALEDLSGKLNDPDNIVRRLGSTHAALLDLLAEHGSFANHGAGGG